MEYRKLGRSGVLVSVIGLGSNQFGRAADEKTTAAIIDRALDLGINHIDTADTYTATNSEQVIGKAIAGKRDKVVLATKTGFPLTQGPNGMGLSRRRITNNLEASLKRLGTDYVDIFYLHRPDPLTPIEESLRAVDDLISAGKVRYLACSNYSGWQVAEMVGIAERKGYMPPIVSQSLYNLLERDIERELIPAVNHFGMSVIPFSPLASGFLTGKYHRGEPIPAGVRGHDNPDWQKRRLTDQNFKALEAIEAFAKEHDRSVSQIAIAWLLAQPAVCSVIAGTTKPEQVDSNVEAAAWTMTAEQAAELERRISDATAA